ncbi:MAG TPA: type II toxin-antitoxin system YoeB family toxin [Clostridiaceae bacterium]|nr:type II toxin-antitoxin system YoeB family toxin [Clostridiaceae bacterium]
MIKVWSDDARDDYLHWQSQDKKTLRKINDLLKDIDRNGQQPVSARVVFNIAAGDLPHNGLPCRPSG